MKNPEIEITKLNGQLKLVEQKLDTLITVVKVLGDKMENTMNLFENYITKNEFQKHIDETKPLLDWVEKRITIEKFIYGVIALVGVTQFATLTILIINILRQ